ncbi:hypothetical protein [uncultured Tateyamaria sp.]|uniref:hypothetical protein n=1 Tax=uncultured Tateyamaria sp. TaxID=455651 RepID=UPI0026328614|nr:hypothetical protein [uncultured Tateyamaria sp.]
MDLPPIDLMLDMTGAPMVRVDTAQEYTDIAALFGDVPALQQPANAETAAKAVNHLAEGFNFGVILDPQTFSTAYFERYDAEEDAEWQQGQSRLRDFGKPDLSHLTPPQVSDGTLVFFADDKYLGLAYRVTMPFDTTIPDYQPVPMGN